MSFRLPWWRREPRDLEPPSPHPGRSCSPACDLTDAAHGYGGVFTAECGADAGATPTAVRLPAVRHVDTARPAADVPDKTNPADTDPLRLWVTHLRTGFVRVERRYRPLPTLLLPDIKDGAR